MTTTQKAVELSEEQIFDLVAKHESPEGLWNGPKFTHDGILNFARALLQAGQAKEQVVPPIPDDWRKFVEDCAGTAGGMVSGNNLSRLAFRLLSASPAPADHVRDATEMIKADHMEDKLAMVKTAEGAEPIAWMNQSGSNIIMKETKERLLEKKGLGGEFSVAARTAERYTVPLYTAQPAESKPAVPEGCKLVPVEPTDAMLDAAGEVETYRDDFGHPFYLSYGEAKDAWLKMIAAAPAQEGGKPELKRNWLRDDSIGVEEYPGHIPTAKKDGE
jgi:hypothetical protein